MCYAGRSAGLIVDTPSALAASSGSGSDHRLKMIKACVDAFHSKMLLLKLYKLVFVSDISLYHLVNVILIVGHEKLNVEMQRTYGKRITVVKIPKSGGVRTRCCSREVHRTH